MDERTFLDTTAETLFALPGVTAVALGGSRAQGTARPDSDWDLSIYYRGEFQPGDLSAVGWDGYVSALGEWGGGVFNGGAWLTIDGRRVDVHYRDRDVVDIQLRAAEKGEFHIEPLAFHLAGIPTYLLVAELAFNRVLRGALPHPAYPDALRCKAPHTWADHARLTLGYARYNHAAHGRLTQCAGQVAVAASCYAHAILAARGEWITNDKALLVRAGLSGVDAVIESMTPNPAVLEDAVERVRALCEDILDKACE
ncbi:nucleotidyltransferase domain-containing protein [Nocardia alni]|uniref:nucleotidyltransferase domain-containing protein n=1 Tax=Nocardia alni TaxID=2815723 RepID=UPI001C24FE20|nr:nucleotidyltransferase domain-containing protein [Nocardia alni]